MASTTMLDLRRDDQMRTLWTPYWLVSSEFGKEADDYAAVLFSFPAATYGTRKLKICEVGLQVVTAFSGGTVTLDIGSGTLATDAVTDGGTVTLVDQDEYVPTANITEGSAAMYWATSGDWITAALLKTNATVEIITPADSIVPCVVAYLTSDATITAGGARLLMQVVEIPLF